MKKCTRCGEYKPSGAFRHRKYYAEERDDLEDAPRKVPVWTELSWCRDCEAEHKRVRRGRPTVVDVLREAGRLVDEDGRNFGKGGH